MRVLTIANRGDEDDGHVGAALRRAGAHLVTVLREDPAPLPQPGDFDVIVSLGSEWSVYWPQVADQVAREEALLRAAVSTGTPVLGICFGAQLLAHALGGTVERAPAPEIGWHTIDSDLPELIPTGPYVQWHYDRFTPPPGAVEVARSAVGSQAFVQGQAVGLQFHPEATPAMLRRWAAAATQLSPAESAELAARDDSGDRDAGERATTIVAAFLSGALAQHARALTG